jgi:hypothetical protein
MTGLQSFAGRLELTLPTQSLAPIMYRYCIKINPRIAVSSSLKVKQIWIKSRKRWIIADGIEA